MFAKSKAKTLLLDVSPFIFTGLVLYMQSLKYVICNIEERCPIMSSTVRYWQTSYKLLSISDTSVAPLEAQCGSTTANADINSVEETGNNPLSAQRYTADSSPLITRLETPRGG